MNANDALTILTATFPGVEFRVRQEAQAFGTNESRRYLSVSYNHIKFPLDPAVVSRMVPGAEIWARGKR